MLSELLYCDYIVLMSETIDRLLNKQFLECNGTFESKGLRVDFF